MPTAGVVVEIPANSQKCAQKTLIMYVYDVVPFVCAPFKFKPIFRDLINITATVVEKSLSHTKVTYRKFRKARGKAKNSFRCESKIQKITLTIKYSQTTL